MWAAVIFFISNSDCYEYKIHPLKITIAKRLTGKLLHSTNKPHTDTIMTMIIGVMCVRILHSNTTIKTP